MNINVKRLKRVTLGGDPLKVFNAGHKKPAFRQNGYGLTFDSANSDCLVGYTDEIVTNLSDLYVSIDLDMLNYNSNEAVFTIGDVSTQYGYFRVATQGGSSFRCYVQDPNGVTSQDVFIDVSGNTGRHIIEIDGLNFKFDGATLHTFTDLVLSFNGNVPFSVNSLPLGVAWFKDTTVYNFTINGEQFNLEESRGTTTTGSLGTIATINTSNAGGVQYLDSTVWNKKSFALELEAVNGEYVSVGDFFIDLEESVEFEVKTDNISQTAFVFGNNSNLNNVSLSTSNFLGLQLAGGGSISFNLATALPNGAINGASFKLTRNIDSSWTLLVNGTDEIQHPILEISPVFNQINQRLTNSNNTDITLYNFSINTEQFNLTEGLGNQVFGSNGTIGTIYTSNAQGIERTNYGQWLKGDDTNGWNPYT